MAKCPICGKNDLLKMYITFAGGIKVCNECYHSFQRLKNGEIDREDFISDKTSSEILRRLAEQDKAEIPCDFCGRTNGNILKRYANTDVQVCRWCRFELSMITNLDNNIALRESEEDVFTYAKRLLSSMYKENTTEVGRVCLDELKKPFDELASQKKHLMVTTGVNFEGYIVDEYITIGNAECLIGTGIISEISTELSDILGGESKVMKTKLAEAKKNALERLMLKAVYNGANGIIGIDYDIFTLGNNNTIIVSANGTFVRVVKIDK